jgi:hypothetical protein
MSKKEKEKEVKKLERKIEKIDRRSGPREGMRRVRASDFSAVGSMASPGGMSTPGRVTEVAAPSAVATINSAPIRKPFRFAFTEEVGEVNTTVDYSNSPLLINPANSELFPYLSNLATLFTAYRWVKLKFRYQASGGTQTAGTVMMAVNGDPERPPLSSETAVLNHQGSVSGPPWSSFEMGGLANKASEAIKTKFVSTVESQLGGGLLEDLHTVADGVLNIATKGLSLLGASRGPGTDPTTLETGKLFVDYIIELFDPVIDTTTGGFNYWTATATSTPPCTLVAWAGPNDSLNGNVPPRINQVPVTLYSNGSTDSGEYWIIPHAPGFYHVTAFWTINQGTPSLPTTSESYVGCEVMQPDGTFGAGRFISQLGSGTVSLTYDTWFFAPNASDGENANASVYVRLQINAAGSGTGLSQISGEVIADFLESDVPVPAVVAPRGTMKCPVNAQYFASREVLRVARAEENIRLLRAATKRRPHVEIVVDQKGYEPLSSLTPRPAATVGLVEDYVKVQPQKTPIAQGPVGAQAPPGRPR